MSQLRLFSAELAGQLAVRLAPSLMTGAKWSVSANRISRVLEDTYAAARDYHQSHQLGWLGRSILANGFRWALAAKGYPDSFIKVATEGLVVELSRRAAKK